MDNVIPATFSRYPLASGSSDTLIGVFPTDDGGIFAVHEHSLSYSKSTSISPYTCQFFSSIAAVSLIYPNILLYVVEDSLYECHVTEGGFSSSILLKLTAARLPSDIFCIATSSAGLFAYCTLHADCSLTIMFYEDECTRALPALKHLCTIVRHLEMPTTASPRKMKASFDPAGLLLAVHVSTNDSGSYLLVLADASSAHFDVTFAKQLNFSSELRTQFKHELSRDRVGWVPCSWRKHDQPLNFHGFTSDGRFLILTCRSRLQSEPSIPTKSEAHTTCCKTTADSTASHECACSTNVIQKYIPYEGRGIALESVEDVSWTPSSYMGEHGDLEWYKQYYGIPKGFTDNLTFSANTMAVYPSSVCLYDPLVLRNPHIVFPLRVPTPDSQPVELVMVQGVRLDQGHHVLVLHRGQGFYCMAVYTTASYTWRLAVEILIPCYPEVPLTTPSYISEDGHVVCMVSPKFLLSTTLHVVLQQSFTGSFSRIQDGMVVYTDLASFCIPPPAYSSCIFRTTEPLIATCIIQRHEQDVYVAIVTKTKLLIVLVSPFNSLTLASEAPAIAGDTSFKEQEKLVQADSVIARVMKGNKKAHFQALNDLEDAGLHNTSYDIITKEELLVDPFRSDHLQEHILTHTSTTLLEFDFISQLSPDVVDSVLRCDGSSLLFPVALQGPANMDNTESKSITIQFLGLATDHELTSVTLRAELVLVSTACSLHSTSVIVNHEQKYKILSSSPEIPLPLEKFRKCFYLKRIIQEKEKNEQVVGNSISSFSEFSSFYWVLCETSTSTGITWLLFTIPCAHPQLVIYRLVSDAPERIYEPIYSCNIEPQSTILYATELSVTLYVKRGYLDVKHPSKLSYFRACSLLKQALALNSSVEDILEVCFESRLLLSSLCRDNTFVEEDLILYFKLLFSSNPILLLRALEAVVCPHEMKTYTATTFDRYNTTEGHEVNFWARFVDWLFENIGFVKDISARSYKDGDELHAACLKSLLRILQLHATYYSGFTKGFGYQNRGSQERVLIELSAAFASAYIAAPGVEGEPSLIIFITHLASAATSYQMNLVHLLQIIELCLFQQSYYVDIHIVADAMGLPISAVATSCFGLTEELFLKCRTDPLLKACTYLAMASNGVYMVYIQKGLTAFYDLQPLIAFPFISSTPLKYQCTSVFTGLDIAYCLILQIFTLLNNEIDTEVIAKVNASIFQFDNWDRKQVALGALHYLKEMLNLNASLLAEVLHEYPLEEYLIRLAVPAATVGMEVVTTLLEIFLPTCEKLKDCSMANKVYLLLDTIAMAIQLRFITEPDYERNTSKLQVFRLRVCDNSKTKSQTSLSNQHSLVHLIFNALSTTVATDQSHQMPEILSELKEIEVSDAIFKILHSLLAHKMVNASHILELLKHKLIIEGVCAAEAEMITQESDINALHKQYQTVRAKMSAHKERHDNQMGKNTRLYQLDEKMKVKKERLESLSNQVHGSYRNAALLLCFCFIV
ncbi:Hypothetical protein GLP15_1259 [Giardia lamblia P15]|uniref:Uncharacterized protein n=1 Tax=Giardia intestinalis (strain P15) TaxID=658858 RepID=E1EZQ2_GIAIA|nr:Hypothetical protein GLP15_1259 [Giardia lamblia P15]